MTSFRGRVEKLRVGEGSRSERDAVVLVTADQGALILDRPDGDPWHDPVLEGLVGEEVEAEGELHRGQLILTSWKERGTPA